MVKLMMQVIDWNPPSHAEGCSLAVRIPNTSEQVTKLTLPQYDAYTLDAGHDIITQLTASGETPVPQLAWTLNLPSKSQKTASEIFALNVSKRRWQKAYMDYWNSTASQTTTGRPVDAFICPTTIMAAALPGKHESSPAGSRFDV